MKFITKNGKKIPLTVEDKLRTADERKLGKAIREYIKGERILCGSNASAKSGIDRITNDSFNKLKNVKIGGKKGIDA